MELFRGAQETFQFKFVLPPLLAVVTFLGASFIFRVRDHFQQRYVFVIDCLEPVLPRRPMEAVGLHNRTRDDALHVSLVFGAPDR